MFKTKLFYVILRDLKKYLKWSTALKNGLINKGLNDFPLKFTFDTCREIKLIDRMSEQNQFIFAFIIQTFCFSVFLTRFLSTQLSQTCARRVFQCWIPIHISLSQEYLNTVNSFVINIPTRQLCLYSYQNGGKNDPNGGFVGINTF